MFRMRAGMLRIVVPSDLSGLSRMGRTLPSAPNLRLFSRERPFVYPIVTVISPLEPEGSCAQRYTSLHRKRRTWSNMGNILIINLRTEPRALSFRTDPSLVLTDRPTSAC